MERLAKDPLEPMYQPGFEKEIFSLAVNELTDEETQGIPRDDLVRAIDGNPGRIKSYFAFSPSLRRGRPVTHEEFAERKKGAIDYIKWRLLAKTIPELKKYGQAKGGRSRRRKSISKTRKARNTRKAHRKQ